jgi:UDP-N-acetylglucosamine 4-epimerase
VYDKLFHEGTLSNHSFLVTGGAGFIGSNIVEYLMKHNPKKVVVLDSLVTGFQSNLQPYLGLPNFEFINADISSLDNCAKAMEGIDFVLHQAALGSVPRSIENPIATNSANVTGFLNMLVAARDARVKRFVYASSSSVYGDITDLPKIEERTGKPLSPYAVSKMVDELYADIFSKTYNMEIIGLRYFNIFGPRQNPKGAYAAAIPLFIDSVLSGKQLFINGDGEHTRDFTFVENAVQANIKALFCSYPEISGKQIYNVAVGDRVSLNKLVKLIEQITQKKADVQYRAERAGDVRDSLAEIKKARQHLNYKPLTQFEDGLRLTVNFFSNSK